MYKEQFLHLPKVYVNRTKFLMKPKCFTTMNVGRLTPLYKPISVVPGDTFKFRSSDLMELTPMLSMVYDILVVDIFCFYCPFRLLWNDYKYFYGENKVDPYDSEGTYTIPQIKIPEGGYDVGTIANYFGIRPGVGSVPASGDDPAIDLEISALPFRAYALIVNEFFIADYLDSKANTNYDISSTVTGSNGDNYVVDLVLGGKPFKANKLHDRFTSCLPKPQAGPSVPLPLGDDAIVYPTDTVNDFDEFSKISGSRFTMASIGSTDYVLPSESNLAVDGNGSVIKTSAHTGGGANLLPVNLKADLGTATATTVSDIRMAVAIQHMLEATSRHGNRYFEQILGEFGVVNDDLTLQRPEYLGGARYTVNNNPVVQTSESNTTPQGTTTSYSITTYSSNKFHKSFKEPGYIIILGVVRYPHSYPQGLDKLWTQKDKLDFYDPHFMGLGEVAVKNHEIYFSGDPDVDDQTFGYMPYGTELRTLDNIATGEMSPDYSQPLLTYHYGDDYDTTPALSSEWLKEDVANVDRTLDKPSTTVMNFRCCFQFSIEATRPIDPDGLPGLRYF